MLAFENHIQWQSVKDVCRHLRENGFQALLAGGCVRDLLMNREPNDFDVATDATPDQVEALFPRSLNVGKAFGVMILPFDGYQIEVATFRVDLEYKDGRRPEGVMFATAEEDAKRRDFTVNALFYDIEAEKTLDYVGGEKDIKAKLLRTVGVPDERFTEDKLRLLRAVRFAAQLDFTIEHETLAAAKAMAQQVSVVSRERIRDELIKLLKAENRVQGLELLIETGLLSAAFPEAHEEILKTKNVWLKRFLIAKSLWHSNRGQKLDNKAKQDALLALFFEPVHASKGEKYLRDQVLKNLKLENRFVDHLIFSLRNLPLIKDPTQIRKGELIELLAHPWAERMRWLNEILCQGDEHPSFRETETYLDQCKLTDGLPPSFLTGDDLIQLGLKPGKKMGQLLREAYLLQLEGSLGTRESAIAWSIEWATQNLP